MPYSVHTGLMVTLKMELQALEQSIAAAIKAMENHANAPIKQQ
jgi:hypothetical protein